MSNHHTSIKNVYYIYQCQTINAIIICFTRNHFYVKGGGGAIRFHNNVRNTFIPAGTNVPVVFREYCRSVLMIVFGLASHYVSVHIVTQVDRMNF